LEKSKLKDACVSVRFLVAAIFLFALSPAFASSIGTGCSNTSLGNGWTCVSGNDIFATGDSVQTIGLADVQQGDLLVLALDMTSLDADVNVTDNAGNTWTQVPGGVSPDAIDAAGHGYALFYVLDSNPLNYAYSATVSIYGGGSPLTTCDLALPCVSDLAISQFRSTSGPARGIEASIALSANAMSELGPCPCAAASQTIVTTRSGDLILGAANQNGAPATVSSGFVPVDSGADCHTDQQPFCFFAATTQDSAGVASWAWAADTPSDPYFSALLAFQQGDAPTAPELPGAILAVSGLLTIVYRKFFR
jgi:hypothetical protein